MQFKLSDRVKLVDVKDAHLTVRLYKDQIGLVIRNDEKEFIDVVMPDGLYLTNILRSRFINLASCPGNMVCQQMVNNQMLYCKEFNECAKQKKQDALRPPEPKFKVGQIVTINETSYLPSYVQIKTIVYDKISQQYQYEIQYHTQQNIFTWKLEKHLKAIPNATV